MPRSHRMFLLWIGLLTAVDLHAGWDRIFDKARANCFVVADSVILVGTDSGCYRSSDHGRIWSFHTISRNPAVPDTGSPVGVASLCTNGPYVFAGTNASVFASTDTGRTWTSIGPAPGGRFLLMLAVYAKGPVVLATMAGGGLFRSTENGVTWSYLGPHRQYDYIEQGPRLFAAAMDGIWNSGDEGLTWTPCGGFPSYRMTVRLANNNGSLFADAFDQLYRSLDSGSTWHMLDTGFLTGGGHFEGIFATEGLVFAGLSGHRIALSRDNGQQWTDISAGLDTIDQEGHFVQFGRSRNKLLSNKDGFLWSYDLSQATAAAPARSGAEPRGELVLWQSYPNPFNAQTTLRYQLPTSGHVLVKVFDLLGREAAVLADGRQEAGVHTIRFNADGLSSGLYLVRITAGPSVRSSRMIVLR